MVTKSRIYHVDFAVKNCMYYATIAPLSSLVHGEQKSIFLNAL